MFRRGLALCAVLGFASVVNAGAVVSLAPTNNGPYLGGEQFTVNVNVTADQSIQPRLLGFDFSASNPAITLIGPDGPDLDTTQEFVFDLSTLAASALYSQFPNFPKPQVVYQSTSPVPGFILQLNSGQEFHAGSLTIKLPTAPGTYLLDAMNATDQDPNNGARIDFDFANRTTLSANNGLLTGGQREFVVIPEPATLILLGLGGVAAAMRRRMA